MRTAFVFAGGGSTAAAEVGMLRALVRHGIEPAFVVGSSAGAINALQFATSPTADGVEALAALWMSVQRSDVFPFSRLRSMLALAGRRASLIDPDALEATLSRRLTVRALEDTLIPCHIVATDFGTGEEVVISTGHAIDALLASAAIPVLFPPRRVGNRLLSDGGISSNAPIATAIALGAERVIVLPTGFPCAVRLAPDSLTATVMHTFALLIARQLVTEIPVCRAATTLRIVPPLCPMHVPPHDFSRAAELIANATAQTEVWIATGGLDHDEIPVAMHPHGHRQS
jgi:NTE family protein